MTLEEAVEVVLQGEAWVVCHQCDGMGWVTKHAMDVGDIVTLTAEGVAKSIENCRLCEGNGGSICKAYAQACTILGREIPQTLLERVRPWGEKIKTLQEKVALATQLPIGYVTGFVRQEGLVKVQHSQEWSKQMQTYQSGRAEYLYRSK